MVFYKITEDIVILKSDQESFKKALLVKFDANISIFNISYVKVHSLDISNIHRTITMSTTLSVWYYCLLVYHPSLYAIPHNITWNVSYSPNKKFKFFVIQKFNCHIYNNKNLDMIFRIYALQSLRSSPHSFRSRMKKLA